MYLPGKIDTICVIECFIGAIPSVAKRTGSELGSRSLLDCRLLGRRFIHPCSSSSLHQTTNYLLRSATGPIKPMCTSLQKNAGTTMRFPKTANAPSKRIRSVRCTWLFNRVACIHMVVTKSSLCNPGYYRGAVSMLIRSL
jgi:hypothetical protein